MRECAFRECEAEANVHAIFEFLGFELEADVCRFHVVLLQANENVTYESLKSE